MNYKLEQTGEQVQELLNQVTPNEEAIAETQGKIPEAASAENQLTDKTYVDGLVNDEETRAKAAEKANADDIDVLEQAVGTGGSVDERIGAAVAGVVGDAASDYNTLGKLEDKLQEEVNRAETAEGTKANSADVYTKAQVDELITTPDVNYVSVVATDATTDVTDVLPASGAADTIYRVGNWDGTQYDDTVYSLYAWNGSAYICLAVRSFIGEVYDISANHPDGQGNPTPYADLTAALGTNGANVPAGIRRGGMSVKFVQSNDNKYVQYLYHGTSTAVADFTNIANWEKINLEEELSEINEKIEGTQDYQSVYFNLSKTDGDISNGNPGFANEGETYHYYYICEKRKCKCLAKVGYNLSYGPELITNVQVGKITAQKDTHCIRFHYKAVNCVPKLQFRQYEPDGTYTNHSLSVDNIAANTEGDYTLLFNYSSMSAVGLAITGMKNGTIVDNTQDAYVEFSDMRVELIEPIVTPGLRQDIEKVASDLSNEVTRAKDKEGNLQDGINELNSDVDDINEELDGTVDSHDVLPEFVLGSSSDNYFASPGGAQYAVYTINGNNVKGESVAPYSVTYGPSISGQNRNGIQRYLATGRKITFHSKLINASEAIFNVVYFTALTGGEQYVYASGINVSAGERDYEFVLNPPAGYPYFQIYALGIIRDNIIDKTVTASFEYTNIVITDVNPYVVKGLKERVTDLENSIGGEVLSQEAYVNSDGDAFADLSIIKEDTPAWATDNDVPTENPYDENGGYIETKLSAVPDGKHFIVFTDTHVEYDYNKEFHLINYVRKRLGGCKVLFLGDALDAGTSDGVRNTDIGKRRLGWFVHQFYNTCGNDAVFVLGNHDSNDANNSSFPTGTIYEKDIWDIAYKSRKTLVFDEEAYAAIDGLSLTAEQKTNLKAWCKMTYYFDDNYNKIRFICLETGCPGSVLRTVLEITNQGQTHYTKYIEQFLVAKALLTLPADYDVVIVGHMIGYGANQMQNHQGTVKESSSYVFADLINAFRNKGTLVSASIPNPSGQSVASDVYRAWVNGMARTFDFSNANSAVRIFFTTGHFHVDGQYILQKNNGDWTSYWFGSSLTVNSDGIFFIKTDRDCYGSPGYNAQDGQGQDLPYTEGDHTWSKEDNSTTSQCFDVVTISGNKIYCTRFGAGEDREFNYKQ